MARDKVLLREEFLPVRQIIGLADNFSYNIGFLYEQEDGTAGLVISDSWEEEVRFVDGPSQVVWRVYQGRRGDEKREFHEVQLSRK